MLPPLPRCSRWAYSSLKLAHPYQPSPKPLSGRPAHRPFRGLLGVYSRCGLHTRAVTKTVTVIRRLQTFRLLHACSGCFRLERSPGGACTRWKSAALSRRTWIPVLRRNDRERRGRSGSGRSPNGSLPCFSSNALQLWLSEDCGLMKMVVSNSVGVGLIKLRLRSSIIDHTPPSGWPPRHWRLHPTSTTLTAIAASNRANRPGSGLAASLYATRHVGQTAFAITLGGLALVDQFDRVKRFSRGTSSRVVAGRPQ